MALALIGNLERNMARIAALKAPEYGLNVGGVNGDIRHHHQHFTRVQWASGAGAALELGKQPIMQDFNLALWTVGNEKFHTAILGRIDHRLLCLTLVQWA